MQDLMADLVDMAERKTIVDIPEFTAERMSGVLEELAARWKRAVAVVPLIAFHSGRAAGYVQSIALILGCEYSEVQQALESGRWWDAG